jgi:hypothetical protein
LKKVSLKDGLFDRLIELKFSLYSNIACTMFI